MIPLFTVTSEASEGPFPWQEVQHSRKDCQSFEAAKRKSLTVRSTGKPVTPQYIQDPDLRRLDRTLEVFGRIESESHMSFTLPKAGATAGHVLDHACKAFESLHGKLAPMTWKFGIHDAHFRWYHSPYGYQYGREKFEFMLVLHAAANPFAPAYLEAALIQRYSSCSAMPRVTHETAAHGSNNLLSNNFLSC